jgi:hypothetical protein
VKAHCKSGGDIRYRWYRRARLDHERFLPVWTCRYTNSGVHNGGPEKGATDAAEITMKRRADLYERYDYDICKTNWTFPASSVGRVLRGRVTLKECMSVWTMCEIFSTCHQFAYSAGYKGSDYNLFINTANNPVIYLDNWSPLPYKCGIVPYIHRVMEVYGLGDINRLPCWECDTSESGPITIRYEKCRECGNSPYRNSFNILRNS